MGQSFPSSWSLSVGVTLLIVLMNTCLVNAQNCVFHTTNITKYGDIWIVDGNSLSEELQPGQTIWDVKTENVSSSKALQYPHGQYMTGYRYTDRYVYLASQSFPKFITQENSTEVNRNVTYGCADGGTMEVHFKFPLEDVNSPPKFTEMPDKDLTASCSQPDAIINVDVPITVKEEDFDESNNNVTVITDRPDILLIETTEKEYYGIGKEFDVKLRLNLTVNPQIGRYSLNLLCTDGTLITSSSLAINIRP